MSKYKTLVKILDELRKEAPPEYKRYYPIETDIDELNKARSRTYIHLFLKVKFGLITFDEREPYITDDTNDGGIDGYYIDKEYRESISSNPNFGHHVAWIASIAIYTKAN